MAFVASDDVMTPDIVGDRLSKAIRILEDVHLTWEARSSSESGAICGADIVHAQSPQVGYSVTRETVVRLWVGHA
jgi:hypothetical protein